MFEKKAAHKTLVVRNETPTGLLARADRDRLSQVLVNLVDNAVKYTPEGGTVTIGGARRPDQLVALWVSDTGSGIPSSDLPRLTERFYRVDKARSRELGGTGLGLAIGPERYNELDKKIRHLNRLLAWGHGKVLENLLEQVPNCERAIADQFGDER